MESGHVCRMDGFFYIFLTWMWFFRKKKSKNFYSETKFIKPN